MKSKFSKHIPLAGIQSVFLFGWLIGEWIFDLQLSHSYILNHFVN
jgi:hypothetical protein